MQLADDGGIDWKPALTLSLAAQLAHGTHTVRTTGSPPLACTLRNTEVVARVLRAGRNKLPLPVAPAGSRGVDTRRRLLSSQAPSLQGPPQTGGYYFR